MTAEVTAIVPREELRRTLMKAADILHHNGCCWHHMIDPEQIAAGFDVADCALAPRAALAAAMGVHPEYMLRCPPNERGGWVHHTIRMAEIALAKYLIAQGCTAARPLPTQAVPVIEDWEQYGRPGTREAVAVLRAVAEGVGPHGQAA